MTFKDFGLSPSVLKALADLGFESPTPIQQLTFQHFAEKDNDLIGLAQTGTGKTAAFSLPILETLVPGEKEVQAIVLSPTRELCLQITKDIQSYSKYLDGINCLAVYGGSSINNQIKELRSGVSIVVGTPGRTLDLIKRKALKLDKIRWVVMDEADEMLSMGFKEDMDAILETCPAERNTLLFSATMPKAIRDIAKNYMRDADTVTAGSANVSASNIQHEYYMVNAKDRYLALKRIADVNPDIYAIIFCRTKAGTQEVADKLGEDGYNADALHGDLSQAQRDFVMSRFRKGQIQMLVATDVAARGIDVDDLTHVIHYQLPDEPEVYIHRSGRTGRAGKEGRSVTIIHSRETRRLKEIERKIQKQIQRAEVPTGSEICEAQLFHLVSKVKSIEVNEEEIAPYLPKINELLGDISKDELIKHFISVEFNRFLEYYQGAENISVPDRSSRSSDRDQRDGREQKGSKSRNNESDFMTRMVINHGHNSGLNPKLLISFLNELLEGVTFNIGRIAINKGNSTFWMDTNALDELDKRMKQARPHGVKIWKDRDQSDDGPPRKKSKFKDGDFKKGGKKKFKKKDKKGKRRS